MNMVCCTLTHSPFTLQLGKLSALHQLFITTEVVYNVWKEALFYEDFVELCSSPSHKVDLIRSGEQYQFTLIHTDSGVGSETLSAV